MPTLTKDTVTDWPLWWFAQLEAAVERDILKRTADYRIGMILQSGAAIDLDGEGRRQEGAADVSPRLGPTDFGEGSKVPHEHGIGGSLLRLALEFLLKLIQR